MQKIRTLIVDDEPLAREGIRLLLEKDPDVEVIGVCANGFEAVAAIDQHRPDLVFLDVQMPEMDGFDVLAQIQTDPMPVVIFVTAYDQHAVRAFEVHAVDYLLKSFTDERFRAALEHAKAQLRQQEVGVLSERLRALLLAQDQASAPAATRPPSPAGSYLHRVVVKAGERAVLVKTHDIDWIEAADYYVRLHVGAATHLLRTSMSKLERQLDPSCFLRIHRSTIVNLDRIKDLVPHFHGDYLVRLHDGTQLKLSRRRRRRLEAALGYSL